MSLPQIAAQIIAVVIIILLGIGAQSKTQARFLFFQLIGNALYVVHYAFLGATTAVIINVICVIRTLIFYLYRRAGKKVPIWMLVIIFAVVIGSGIWTWDGWLSIIPIFTTIIFTFAQWQKNVQLTRILIAFGDLGWIIYNIFYLAFVDIIGKSIEIISCLIAALRFRENRNLSEAPKTEQEIIN